jgi:hypothetical protein
VTIYNDEHACGGGGDDDDDDDDDDDGEDEDAEESGFIVHAIVQERNPLVNMQYTVFYCAWILCRLFF